MRNTRYCIIFVRFYETKKIFFYLSLLHCELNNLVKLNFLLLFLIFMILFFIFTILTVNLFVLWFIQFFCGKWYWLLYFCFCKFPFKKKLFVRTLFSFVFYITYNFCLNTHIHSHTYKHEKWINDVKELHDTSLLHFNTRAAQHTYKAWRQSIIKDLTKTSSLTIF